MQKIRILYRKQGIYSKSWNLSVSVIDTAHCETINKNYDEFLSRTCVFFPTNEIIFTSISMAQLYKYKIVSILVNFSPCEYQFLENVKISFRYWPMYVFAMQIILQFRRMPSDN